MSSGMPSFPPYNVYAVILQRLDAIHRQQKVQGETLTSLVNADQTDYTNLLQAVNAVLAFITTPPMPRPVAAFTLTVTTSQGEKDMAEKVAQHKMKVSMNPDGTATATITGVVDKFGNPTTFLAPPTYVCETTVGAGADPGITLTPAADGMTCGIAANGALVASDTLTATGDTISQSYNPITVKAGPANSFVLGVA